MGNCYEVKSSPNENELNSIEREAHDEIETRLTNANRDDGRVNKYLLFGTGSSGKSTIFEQLKCVYGYGFSDEEYYETIPIIRQNCVSGIITLLRKTHQHKDNYIDLNYVSQSVLNAIKIVANMQYNTFQDYENMFISYMNMNDDDSTYIDDNIERQIQEKKNELHALSQSLQIIWGLTEIKSIYKNRYDQFFIPDNMEYFFTKIDQIFEWNYQPSIDDMLRCRIQTTGLHHKYYELDDVLFTITDVSAQNNEKRKWIHCFEGFSAVIFVAALNHYASVLFEDPSKNAMIESIELFYEICNLKWFRRTEFILFLNKDDLFRECIIDDIPLSICFNDNTSIYKPYYENDESYIPQNERYIRYHNIEYSAAHNDAYIYNCELNLVIYGYLRNIIEDTMIIDYSFIFVMISGFLRKGYSNCAIYPKPDLRYSAKNMYDNGKWEDQTDQEWFEYVYNDYLYWIKEQYLCRNLYRNSKRVFVHITTATDSDNIQKVFWDVQNIIFSSNLPSRS